MSTTAVLLVLLAAFPYLGTSGYHVSLASTVLVAAILASTVNFLAAEGGLASLGHGAIAGAAASHGPRPVVVRPVLVHPTGFRMSPYADIKPAGDDAGTAARRAASGPPRKLWHSRPGSSGH